MKIFFICLFTLIALSVRAQHISVADHRFLQIKEDSLKAQAYTIETGRELVDRFKADSMFTRILVRALVTKNSFYYPFDSLLNISRLYAPDSSFRMYTWQLTVDENLSLQHGAIQMRTADGSFKKFVLIDKSNVIKNISDTITDNSAWPGAVYYKIIRKTYNSHVYYTLLGFDANNIRSDKKIMDILEFVNGAPVFGSKIFVMGSSSPYEKDMARFTLEYKKGASPRLSYDADLDAVVFDELSSESGNSNQKWTMIPDGEYEGFVWRNGKWIYTPELFGKTPVQKYTAPQPIRDAQGNIDNSKLKGREDETPQH